jgi:hypothetical protein
MARSYPSREALPTATDGSLERAEKARVIWVCTAEDLAGIDAAPVGVAPVSTRRPDTAVTMIRSRDLGLPRYSPNRIMEDMLPSGRRVSPDTSP